MRATDTRTLEPPLRRFDYTDCGKKWISRSLAKGSRRIVITTETSGLEGANSLPSRWGGKVLLRSRPPDWIGAHSKGPLPSIQSGGAGDPLAFPFRYQFPQFLKYKRQPCCWDQGMGLKGFLGFEATIHWSNSGLCLRCVAGVFSSVN